MWRLNLLFLLFLALASGDHRPDPATLSPVNTQTLNEAASPEAQDNSLISRASQWLSSQKPRAVFANPSRGFRPLPRQDPGPRDCEPVGASLLSKQIDLLIKKYASLHRVEEKLVWAVMRQESGGNPRALSPKGAMGLMQLMPETATLMGVRAPFDVEQNIAGGIKYLERCLAQFNQDVILALAAYNAGPENVAKYQGCPPFFETLNYVAAVLRDYAGEPRLRGLKFASCNFPSIEESSSPPLRDSGLHWQVPAPHWKVAAPRWHVPTPQWQAAKQQAKNTCVLSLPSQASCQNYQ